ncbi:hypothetical protein ABZX92_42170 [Lentzea sp. NPDC006480]|uniref:hypothetical protein n=1 Tax=Lentzea sp. NPDC006480 TaxID=3157176 RepID=UPI0033AB78AF
MPIALRAVVLAVALAAPAALTSCASGCGYTISAAPATITTDDFELAATVSRNGVPAEGAVVEFSATSERATKRFGDTKTGPDGVARLKANGPQADWTGYRVSVYFIPPDPEPDCASDVVVPLRVENQPVGR